MDGRGEHKASAQSTTRNIMKRQIKLAKNGLTET